MHRARKLVRAERAHRAGADPGRVDMEERTLGFARVWKGYYERLESHPDLVEALLGRVREYDEDLRALKLHDHELDRGPRLASPWLAGILVLQVVTVFVLLPPLLFVGYAINLPPLVGLWALSKTFATQRKDEASIKLMFGAIAFPAAWISAAALVIVPHEPMRATWPGLPDAPWLAAAVTVVLGILGGMLALRYSRLVRETMRAVRVRLTRARRRVAVARLRVERAELFDAVMALAAGLELPGTVLPSGRIAASD